MIVCGVTVGGRVGRRSTPTTSDAQLRGWCT